MVPCGSALLRSTPQCIIQVSTITQITLNLPAAPVLILFPLAIYLTTFITAFSSPHWYPRPIFSAFLPIAVAGSILLPNLHNHLDVPQHLASYGVILYFGCMSCHGELVRLRPGPSLTTLFYLLLALGGVLGGLMVTVISPNVLAQPWEYQLSFSVACLFVLWRLRDGRRAVGARTDLNRSDGRSLRVLYVSGVLALVITLSTLGMGSSGILVAKERGSARRSGNRWR